jgi:hypothetical protein
MKAEELRAVAEQMPNPVARDCYRRLAETYEAMARDEPRRGQEGKKADANG